MILLFPTNMARGNHMKYPTFITPANEHLIRELSKKFIHNPSADLIQYKNALSLAVIELDATREKLNIIDILCSDLEDIIAKKHEPLD